MKVSWKLVAEKGLSQKTVFFFWFTIICVQSVKSSVLTFTEGYFMENQNAECEHFCHLTPLLCTRMKFRNCCGYAANRQKEKNKNHNFPKFRWSTSVTWALESKKEKKDIIVIHCNTEHHFQFLVFNQTICASTFSISDSFHWQLVFLLPPINTFGCQRSWESNISMAPTDMNVCA